MGIISVRFERGGMTGVIPFVRAHLRTPIPGEQPVRLGAVRRLSAGPDEPQAIPQTVYAHVDVRAEAATAAAPGLGGWSPPPLSARADHPQDPINETLAIRFLPNVAARAPARKLEHLGPLCRG